MQIRRPFEDGPIHLCRVNRWGGRCRTDKCRAFLRGATSGNTNNKKDH
jgi:uracil-DNA glycosylase